MTDLSPSFRKARRLLRINRLIGRLLRLRVTPHAFRKNMARLMRAGPPEGIRRIDVDAGGVPAAWFVPEPADTTRAIVHFHGGGYVAGSIDTHAEFAGHLARETGIPVLVPDYRLAPESPFPAALEDALATMRWLRETGLEGAPAPISIRVSGDSAGGGLGLATLMELKKAGDPMPDRAVLISPWADLGCDAESVGTRARADLLLTGAMLREAAAAYAGQAPVNDPRISPVNGDFADLPPLYLIVGDAEILLDDSVEVARNAKHADVEVTLDVWDQMLHVWMVLWPAMPEGRSALLKIADFLSD